MSSTASLFEIQNNPAYTLVRFFGFIDAAMVEKVKPVIQNGLPSDCARLIIDLEKVDFLDSHGVGMFVSLLKKVHHNQGKLYIAGTEGQPASVLQMVGFNGPLVRYCANANEARELCEAK